VVNVENLQTDSRQTVRKKRRQHDPEGNKRDILAVAMHEFAEHGLAGARIAEIAERTKTSKRMIYYYFTDKENLYVRCLEEAYRIVREGEANLALDHLAPVDAMRTLVEFTFDHHESHKEFIRMVMIENIHNGTYLDQSKVIQTLNRTAINNLKSIYDRGVENGEFRPGLRPLDLHWHISALSFFNVSNRATFSRIFGEDQGSTAAIAMRRSQVVDMVLHFLKPE
jgi:AcrR family transcriptional regulator